MSRTATLYLTGLAASLLGTSAMTLVAGIWAKSLTGSSAKAGLVSACVYAPTLLGPLAGVVADRVHRGRLLVGVNLASAAVVLTLLAVHSPGQLWLLYLAMLAYGAGMALSDPAEGALAVDVLPAGVRQRVNGWRLGIQETGRLVAPLLGAGLFSVLGGGTVAALDAATFLVAAATVALIRAPATPRGPVRERWRTALTAGLRHIRATRELRRVLAAACAVMVVSGVVVPAQYNLVSALGRPPAFLGVLTAALGAGSVVAALLSTRVLRVLGERGLAVAGLVDFAAGSLLRATGWLPAAVLGSLVLGFALPWTFLATVNLAQRSTPDHLQGRVWAAVTLALFGPQAPAQSLGALVITHLTYRQVYLAAAVAAVLIGCWLVFSPAVPAGRWPPRRCPRRGR